MATSLGSLVVSLGLNAAEYTAGLSKAEFQAQKFAKSLDKAIATAARTAATAVTEIGLAALGAFAAIDQLAKEAGKFKDLEEITGASAESLASFSTAARIASTDMTTIASASVKLTKNLTGVDDESTAAGAALKALGINIKDFKALDPATQIDAIAKALAGFADGAGKTAVATALFGKAGAELLPFLAELGKGIGRQTILTQAQIEAADAYADAQARSKAQLLLFAEALATQGLFAVTAFQESIKETVKQMLGLDAASTKVGDSKAVVEFADRSARFLGILAEAVLKVADAFERTGITFAALAAEVASGSFAAAAAIKKEADADIARINNRKSFVSILDEQLDRQRKIAVGLALISKDNEDRNDRLARKPTLDFQGKAPGAKGGGRDRVSEADRFLESLRKQLEKTEELTVAETILRDIQEGRLKFLSPAQQTQALGIAAQIDAAHDLATAIKEINKVQEEQNRVAQAAVKETIDATKAAENQADTVLQGNEHLRDEIAIMLGGEDARRAIEKDYIKSAIARKEDALAIQQQIEGHQGIARAIAIEIDGLKERLQLLTTKDIVANLKAEADAMNAFKNTITDEFANAFEGFIDGTKSAKDAFKDFATSVQKYLTQLALHKVGDSIFGSTTAQGPDIFSMLPKLLGIGGTTGEVVKTGTEATGAAALTGSATALTGAGGALTASSGALDGSAVAQTTAAGLLTGAAGALSGAALALTTASATGSASDIAGLLGSGIGLAQGGGLASGSNFTFGGGTWVGENGPEFVDMPRGARVWPNGTGPNQGMGGDTITINMQVLPGANTQTARQAGNFVRDAVSARARDR